VIICTNTPGRGETGSDISAILPTPSKELKFLRDGASAQYGSDAMGVMNIILKKTQMDHL
jgi:iron complex outermembrane receptor protein